MALILFLDRNVATVGLFAVHDLHDVGHQQWISFLVELERAAGAVEADLSQGIANLAAVFATRLLYCKQRHRDRVIGLGMIRVSYLVVGLLDFGDQLLRRRNAGGR